MKRAALSLSLIVIPVLGIMASKTFASESHVSVKTTGDSNASVHISSDVNSTSNSTSSTDSHTHVEITTDGETKTYDSDKPEDVNIESNDGTAKVHINNTGSTTTTEQNNDEAEKKAADIKAEVKKKIQAQKDALKKKQETAKAKKAEVKMNFFQSLWSHFISFFTLSKR